MRIVCVTCVLWMALIAQSCSSKGDYDPESHLTVKEKDAVLQSVIRYMGKPPENVSASERFETKYDDYYLDIASRYKFERYYIDAEKIHYFLISRPAPSLYEKRVAIGGKLKLNEQGEVVDYEEVFRTWKMKDEELSTKGLFLFDLMVTSKDLSPYYRGNSTTEYIEFPDEHNYYDKNDRSWKVK